MLIGRGHFKEHLPWVLLLIVASGFSIIWYLSFQAGTSWEFRPKGSEGPLFIFGIAGGAICLFEFLLWPRKHWRVVRLGRTKIWMRAHIWLGILSVPLLVLHSGFYFSNLEATLLFLLFAIVIISGVWGLIMQQFIPRKMLDEIPAETIYSQIDHMSELLYEEGEKLVLGTCGLPDEEEAEREKRLEETQHLIGAPTEADPMGNRSHITVGAVRVVGGIRGKVLETMPSVHFVDGCEPLREYFRATIEPYLKDGNKSRSPLKSPVRCQEEFNRLRQKYPEAAHEAIGALESLCDQRRQFERQKRLHAWLHNWLSVHLPLSIALIILMFIHIVVTIKYWWPG